MTIKFSRLPFEKRFQFAARLAPTFLSGGMIAGDFLRQPNQKRSSPS